MLTEIFAHFVNGLLCGVTMKAVARAMDYFQFGGGIHLQRLLRVGQRNKAVLVTVDQRLSTSNRAFIMAMTASKSDCSVKTDISRLDPSLRLDPLPPYYRDLAFLCPIRISSTSNAPTLRLA